MWIPAPVYLPEISYIFYVYISTDLKKRLIQIFLNRALAIMQVL